MKLTASLLVLCTFVYYASAHVSYSAWRVIDTVCQRPSTGKCAEAGTCCGEKLSGTQKLERDCTHDVCPPEQLKKTQGCTIRCAEADKDAYGPWVRAGNCERPDTGDCSADGTCCGERKGTMKHTRECKAANGCTLNAHSGSGSTLERQFQCNLRCGYVNPCRLYPNPCENGGTCNEDGHSHTCTCVGGYTGHHCEDAPPCSYSISSGLKTFAGAKQHCIDNGGVLAGKTVRKMADRKTMESKLNVGLNKYFAGYWFDLTPVDPSNLYGNWQWQKGSDDESEALRISELDAWNVFSAINRAGKGHPCAFMFSIAAPYGNRDQQGWDMMVAQDRSCTQSKNYALCEHHC